MSVLDGLLGLAVGDALGVPVEFCSREKLREKPVVDMIGHGTYNQVAGTWSDDSSLAFCLAESLCRGFDLEDQGKRFGAWLFEQYWTPHGKVFDVGHATREAIFQLKSGKVAPVDAGGQSEQSNGNGSLMRILPLAFWLRGKEDAFTPVQKASCLTHAHPRSQLGCLLYIQYALALLTGRNLEAAYDDMVVSVQQRYANDPVISREFKHYERILKNGIATLPENKIRSEGYVVYTLEAALWCLLRSTSYPETVLQAVNLGNDTDTTAAVAGGLAGIHYGTKAIPEDWLRQLARYEDIVDLAQRLEAAL